jgi:hypothetical protein
MAKGPANPERAFGVSVGTVLCLIAAVLLWRERIGRAELIGGIGAVLLVFGLAWPSVLRRPSALWWRFSRVLGTFNARVLLTVMFAVVFVPISFLWRLVGKDPLQRRREQWHGWSAYPAKYRDPHHYRRMF